MKEEVRKFKSEYFYTPRRTTLPYDRDEAIKNKFKKIDENKISLSNNKEDIEK